MSKKITSMKAEANQTTNSTFVQNMIRSHEKVKPDLKLKGTK